MKLELKIVLLAVLALSLAEAAEDMPKTVGEPEIVTKATLETDSFEKEIVEELAGTTGKVQVEGDGGMKKDWDDANPEGKICEIVVDAIQEAKNVAPLTAALFEVCDRKKCHAERPKCKDMVNKTMELMKTEKADVFCKHFRPQTLEPIGLLRKQLGVLLSCPPHEKTKVCEIILSSIQIEKKIDALKGPSFALCDKRKKEHADKCKEHVINMIESLHKYPAKGICHHLRPHMVDAIFAEKHGPPPHVPLPVCEICKKAIQTVKDSGKINDSLKSTAEVLCQFMMVKEKIDKCKETVGDFYTTWTTKNAQEICNKIKMC